jgi:3-methyladenine DNA glycosylase AlkC
VQNSVANWLNDAGKSQPAWLRDLADKWAAESPTTHTQYILRRGLRSVPPPASPSTKKQTRKRH